MTTIANLSVSPICVLSVTSQPENLSINSEARAPLIHMSVNGKLTSNGTDYSLEAVHSLDYAPWFLTYISVQGTDTYQAFFGGQGTNILTTSPTSVKQRSTLSTLQGTIIVLKDPFLL